MTAEPNEKLPEWIIGLADDELAAMKKQHNRQVHTREFPTHCSMCRLFTRLERAEAVCAASSKVVRPKERIGNAPLEQAIFNALEAWRKSKGK